MGYLNELELAAARKSWELHSELEARKSEIFDMFLKGEIQIEDSIPEPKDHLIVETMLVNHGMVNNPEFIREIQAELASRVFDKTGLEDFNHFYQMLRPEGNQTHYMYAAVVHLNEVPSIVSTIRKARLLPHQYPDINLEELEDDRANIHKKIKSMDFGWAAQVPSPPGSIVFPIHNVDPSLNEDKDYHKAFKHHLAEGAFAVLYKLGLKMEDVVFKLIAVAGTRDTYHLVILQK